MPGRGDVIGPDRTVINAPNSDFVQSRATRPYDLRAGFPRDCSDLYGQTNAAGKAQGSAMRVHQRSIVCRSTGDWRAGSGRQADYGT